MHFFLTSRSNGFHPNPRGLPLTRLPASLSCFARRWLAGSLWAMGFTGWALAAGPVASRSFSVRDFGAVGDGVTKDTAAFQNALDTCAIAGGGEVLVAPGTYLIGSIQLGSRTYLRLEPGSILRGSGDLADYPMIDVRWEGRWQPGHRALIYAANVDHIGITGPGRIEGNAAVAAPQNPRGVVVLEPISCDDVVWDGFTVIQGGNWATHPTYCTNVSIRNLTIMGNRDGIDVDSCRGVRIEHCTIDTGDDSISLKSGRGRNGARIGRPTEEVAIVGCRLRCRRFACIGIGSETSGGIRDIRIERCAFDAHTAAIYIKTRIGRAGVTENIIGDDLEVAGGSFLRVNLVSAGNRNTNDDPVEGPLGIPEAKNLRFSNIRIHGQTLVQATQISPEKPLLGLSLTQVSGTCEKGILIANAHAVVLRGIEVSGFAGPLIAVANVTGEGLESAAKLPESRIDK